MKNNFFAPILGAYYFFYFALIGAYIIFMPEFLSRLGYTPFEVGVIYASAPFMRFLTPFIFKYFLILTPKVYKITLFLTALLTLLFFITINNFYLYLLTNLIFGAMMSVSLPYVETIAISILSKQNYGKVRLWGSIGFMIIALWLGKVLTTPKEILYYLTILSFLTLFFGVLLVKYDNIIHTTPKEDKTFSLKLYGFFWLSLFLMQVGFGGFYNFFTIYEVDRGISLEVISYMWSFGVVCEVIMLYFQAPLLQRNLLTIIQFATLLTAIRWFILFYFSNSITMTFISQAFHAISFALYHTATMSYLFLLYRQKKLAQQFFLGIAYGLGASVGAIISGQVYGDYLFLIEGFITILAGVSLFIHQKRKSTL